MVAVEGRATAVSPIMDDDSMAQRCDSPGKAFEFSEEMATALNDRHPGALVAHHPIVDLRLPDSLDRHDPVGPVLTGLLRITVQETSSFGAVDRGWRHWAVFAGTSSSDREI